MKRLAYIPVLLSVLMIVPGCTFLFGDKEDATVNEIFEQGAIDPRLVPNHVGYVPILPILDGFSNPVDVYVGYDEMIYVVDDKGLNVLDQTGTLHDIIPIPGALEVVQNRRLHTYVAGRVNVEVGGQMHNLAAVYHIINTATADPVVFLDTLIHPFCDDSRPASSFRGAADEAVRFTGLTTLADNTLYVARQGPTNDLASIYRPDNAILFYDALGNNIGYANGLNPVSSSLKSILQPVGLAGFAAPPQRLFGISNSADFLVVQGDPSAQYKVLWIRKVVDPVSGPHYVENAKLVVHDTGKATRFLYEPGRFERPMDVYIAPDATGYIFVVDAGTDSLYQFTQAGYEGVNPPPTSTRTKQIICSFGGTGQGQFEFRDPSGVCYFRNTVYVADKLNNRILRFKLSTDLE